MNNVKCTGVRLRPLYDRILVEVETTATESKCGIILPDNAKKKKSKGMVRAIGGGRLNNDGSLHPLSVKVGDKILFGKWAGTDVNSDDDDADDGFKIVKEDDVLAIIEE